MENTVAVVYEIENETLEAVTLQVLHSSNL